MGDFIDKLKNIYKTGDVMIKIIFINSIIFLLIKAFEVVLTLLNLHQLNFIQYLAVPSDLTELLQRIWTPITYMFVHNGFWHILFNMLWLYWFGSIFMQYFSGRTLGSLYYIGGLSGAILYIVAFNLIPFYIGMGDSLMIGASAAVMAVVMGIAFYRPEIRINLFLFGSIRIIYIAVFVFLLDFLALDNVNNPGGHVAHIGGAIAGYIFASRYKKGNDITEWMSVLVDKTINLFKPKNRNAKMKVTYKKNETDRDYNFRKQNDKEEIDAILDKLKRSGYSSLSVKEKEKLFNASKK
jgi:membrane associated rhomboid family serine protease